MISFKIVYPQGMTFFLSLSYVLHTESRFTSTDGSRILYGYVDFETEYPKAIAELEAAGINEYVAEVNRQLAEFMAK